MLYFVPTPIGNLEDVSQRSLKLFCESSVVFCEDTRVAKSLLNLLKDKFALEIKPKKFIPFHSHNENEIISKLDIEIFNEICIFLSDAGMPCVSDPGAKLVLFCQENGINYDVLAGANALLLGYCASGFEGSFTFWSFLPHKGKEREQKLNELLASKHINILYESPHRLEKLMQELEVLMPQRKAFAIKEATKKFQEYFHGTILQISQNLKTATIKGEWTIIIDKNPNSLTQNITIEDINSLKIPPKQKAKLLSKITNLSVQECYDRLCEK